MPSPEVIPPVSLQKAQERGYCSYSHLTIQATIPPAPEPGVKVVIRPPKDVYCWRLFAFVFGALNPAGISADFIVRHRGPRTALHDDPWIHSIVDWPIR